MSVNAILSTGQGQGQVTKGHYIQKRSFVYRSSQLYNSHHEKIGSLDVISTLSFKKLARDLAKSI